MSQAGTGKPQTKESVSGRLPETDNDCATQQVRYLNGLCQSCDAGPPSCPSGSESNSDSTQDGRLVAQMELLSAVHIQRRSRLYPVVRSAGNRPRPIVRSSWLAGMLCSA